MPTPLTTTAPHRDDTADAYQKSVERVIRHMKEHFASALDLEAIAEIAAISKFHFVRVFDELTGTTPHHFLACLRMQRAKELLLRTDLTTKRLDAMRFAGVVFRFLASKRKESGPQLEGIIEGPARPRGFTFVGTFTRGVPQGVPDSGTVLLTRGKFRVKRPAMSEFHLMAVLVPFTAKLTDMVTTLPVGLVASLRLQNYHPETSEKPCLRLRPLRPTDPPIVLALPSLPPLLASK